LGPRRTRALASVAVLGLICALGGGGAAAGGSNGARATSTYAACGKGYPKPPPKRYRFRVSGTTGWRFGLGTETYLYKGVVKRMRCRGTHVEYWQTKGTFTRTFKDLYLRDVPGCGDDPPYGALGNAPTTTTRLRRFGTDIGFYWSGNRYTTGAFNPANPRSVPGTYRCLNNGATTQVVFIHRSTNEYTRQGVPKQVVKGKANDGDIELYKYNLRWKLTAIR